MRLLAQDNGSPGGFFPLPPFFVLLLVLLAGAFLPAFLLARRTRRSLRVLVFGFFFLDQKPTLIEYMGISLVLLGVVVQQRDVLPSVSETA